MVKLSQNGQPIFGTFVVEDEEEDYGEDSLIDDDLDKEEETVIF